MFTIPLYKKEIQRKLCNIDTRMKRNRESISGCVAVQQNNALIGKKMILQQLSQEIETREAIIPQLTRNRRVLAEIDRRPHFFSFIQQSKDVHLFLNNEPQNDKLGYCLRCMENFTLTSPARVCSISNCETSVCRSCSKRVWTGKLSYVRVCKYHLDHQLTPFLQRVLNLQSVEAKQ
jgi:hypothetical protein